MYKGCVSQRYTAFFSSSALCIMVLTSFWLCSTFTHLPLRIGDHVFVGQNSVVQAASIGSHVHIGQGVAIGEMAIIKDYTRVLDGAVVPPHMVIPSFSIVAGRPARVIGEVPEGGHEAFELRELYKTVGNNPQPAPV
jgi:dynactin-5